MVMAFHCLRMLSKNRCCSKVSSLLTICALFVLFGISETKSCTQDGQCKCTFDDGSGTVDLSPLGHQDGTPMIQDKFAADNYAYSFNPCYPFTEGTCVNAADLFTYRLEDDCQRELYFGEAVYLELCNYSSKVTLACQYDSNNNIYYNIGDSSKVTLSYDGLNVIGDYVSDDGARSSKVTFTCDPSKDPPDTQANGETSTTVYEFTVTSKYACPQGDGPGPGPGPGPNPSVDVSVSVSVGSVLVIVFFSVVIVYIISGILFNKFYRHNTGREVVPNVTLWMALPGLIKDGVMFCVSKITRRGGYRNI